MKKIIVFSFLIIFCSCSAIMNSISPITERKVKRKGYILETNDTIINLDRFLKFKSKIENGMKDKIKIVTYSIEGDPIINTYKSDGKQIKISSDMRRDKYSLFAPFRTTKGVFKGFREIQDTIIELDSNLQDKPIEYTKYYIAIKQYNQRLRVDTFLILKRKIGSN